MGRAVWMAGRWGIMVHWIAPGPPPECGPYRTDLNDAVDHFDVPRFLSDFAATGADWLIFTVGQNTGYYASPNALLDKWAGPGHFSNRDLVQEIMDGVTSLSDTSHNAWVIREKLQEVSINRVLTVRGIKVHTLRMFREAGIDTALDLKDNSILSKVSNRDAEALNQWLQKLEEEAHIKVPFAKRFIAYLPCEVAANTTVHRAFEWTTKEHTDQRHFQRKYTRFIQEYAERWGEKCSGWWFDGCYRWPVFHNKFLERPRWFDACYAGNPKAALAFNDGSFCIGNKKPVYRAEYWGVSSKPDAYRIRFNLQTEQDYLSGEVELLVKGKIRLGRGIIPRYHLPKTRTVKDTGCQWHALVPIDCVWAHGTPPTGMFAKRFAPVPSDPIFPMEKPVYSDDELVQFMNACLSVGGAVTLNVGIYQEGHLGPETVAQLHRIAPRLHGAEERKTDG